ncbi:MAG: decaprenyl-phosphate phosphoribosyltransferase [Melioribacteraceae bacterium]|nr:decaprenyl-phosphate phosphoribosyltransferase [Melioribacteraceae bacterium]MCF8266249.1 decaprenyl-phosphate phosphoribosyltransferase [Melioribacteraceae bacterium]MCF8412538.1 decaprenyl-phosphate phosphoribosyltransferase [Melioribacteraceae bacterium]MCF8432014.1 decaprenyl-phosphate phosphoribosyltransferase [Melioribacteraceae bacterium]
MIKQYLKLMRISHWIKNFFVFVPLVFSKHLTDFNYGQKVIFAFLIFSLVSSFVYVINDLMDVEVDRHHPKKKDRPIASGKISPLKAKILAIGLLAVVGILLPFANTAFTVAVIAYLIINFLYSVKLKRIVIVDLMCLASGFMLRVLGGAYIINVAVSNWLILTTLFLSIFLAIMKRKSELENVSNHSETRKVLQDYPNAFVDQISAVSATGVLLCYSLYSVSERTVQYFKTEYLVYTTIFVVFGVFRYMYLVYKQHKGENTIEIVVKDIPMLINSVLYGISLLVIIYLAKMI